MVRSKMFERSAWWSEFAWPEPGVRRISTSSPWSRKKPSSRATSSGRSWMAFIIEAFTFFRLAAIAPPARREFWHHKTDPVPGGGLHGEDARADRGAVAAGGIRPALAGEAGALRGAVSTGRLDRRGGPWPRPPTLYPAPGGRGHPATRRRAR